jgi:aspartokinase/homoserine dehydrogenase 1
VIAGFQGISTKGQITTLGRGGSDMTAIALAHSLGADVCEIYTDVDGVYTADPRLVKNARLIKEISWEEMIELSKHGAAVLQARSAEFARKYEIKVLIKNAHKETRGTLIWEGKTMEEPIVRAVTSEDQITKVVLYEVPDRPGIAATIMRTLSDQHITIDMIIQSMRTGAVNTMAFIIPNAEMPKLKVDVLKKRSAAKEIIIEKNFAKVSVVGVNLTSSSEIGAILFETMAKAGINIDMVIANNSRISTIIDKNKVEDAVKSIHSTFRLDEEL